jgi:predicted transcriptional regulator
MDIQALKIDLAHKILKSNNPSLLQKIDQIFRSEDKEDCWWEELPKEIQDSISQGLKEAESDNLLTHEQVVQETRAKYGF